MDYQAVIILKDGTKIGSELVGVKPTFQQIRMGLIQYGGVSYRVDTIENCIRKNGEVIEANYE